MSRISAAVILLNWNNFEDTRACVSSLLEINFPKLFIYVVDNGSANNDVEKLKGLSPQIMIFRNPKNLGFAGGCNTGLRAAVKAGLDYGWLLNNDAVVNRESLQELADFMESHPKAAFAGSAVYHEADPEKFQSAGGKILRETGWGTFVGCDETDSGQYVQPQETDYVSGCSLLVRVKALAKIGYLDESFFPIYYEDTDWSLRAQKAGWQTWIVPSSKVWHKDKASTGERKTRYVYQNYFLFLSKHFRALLFSALRVHFRRRLGPHILQGKWKAAWNDFLAYWGFFVNRFLRQPHLFK